MRALLSRLTGRIFAAALSCLLIAGVMVAPPAGAVSTTSISGTVTAAVGGADLSGICVSAYLNGGDTGTGTSTASNGTYTINGLVPGTYSVQFYTGCGSSNLVWQWYNGTASGTSTEADALGVAVSVVSPGAGIDAQMVVGATISGTITAAVGGADLAGVCVGTIGSVSSQNGVSGANGTYTISGVSQGTYQLEVDPTCSGVSTSSYSVILPSSTLMVTTSETITGQNFALAVSGTISGTVVDATSPGGAEGVCVWANQTDSGPGIGLAMTASNGSYSLTNLNPGSYDILFDPTCGGATTSPYAMQEPSNTVLVNSGATTTLDFDLVLAGSIADAIAPSTPPTNATVGGNYTPNATATSNDTVAITLDGGSTGCTLSAGVVNFTAAGNCLVDFNDPMSGPNAAYGAAPQVQQNIVVTPAALPAVALSATAISSTDVFVVGRSPQSALWYQQSSGGGATWTGWQSLPTTDAASQPAVVENGSDLFVFFRATDNEVHYFERVGSTWGTEQDLGGVIAGNPTAAVDGNGRIIVATLNGAGNVFEDSLPSGGSWTGWNSLAGVLSGNVGLSSMSGDVYLLGLNGSGLGWTREWTAGTTNSWGSWTSLGGVFKSGTTLSGAASGGTLHVQGVNPQGILFESTGSGSSWSAWTSLNGILSATPTLVAPTSGLFMFDINAPGLLWDQEDTSSWQGWNPLSGVLEGAPVAAAAGSNAFVFGLNDAGNLWFREWNGTTFGAWTDLGGILATA
jgi:hypothetical protein